jgi:hypothetical protein
MIQRLPRKAVLRPTLWAALALAAAACDGVPYPTEATQDAPLPLPLASTAPSGSCNLAGLGPVPAEGNTGPTNSNGYLVIYNWSCEQVIVEDLQGEFITHTAIVNTGAAAVVYGRACVLNRTRTEVLRCYDAPTYDTATGHVFTGPVSQRIPRLRIRCQSPHCSVVMGVRG